MADRPTTLAAVLDAAGRYLADKRIQDPRRVAELLMSSIAAVPILELPLRAGTVLTELQLERLRNHTRRAASGEPVQYILGDWDFMGHTFKVDRRALIPRPETEVLVESVLACLAVWDDEVSRPCVLDVGTGTGCIVISLALARPDAAYVAVDVSEDALMLARENAEKHGVADSIAFSNQDLADVLEPGSVSAVVANLPYIPTREYERLPEIVRGFEPRLALDGGQDGFDVIRQVAEDAAILLRNGGWIFLEIGADQGRQALAILDELGFSNGTIRKDLAGRDRIVSALLA